MNQNKMIRRQPEITEEIIEPLQKILEKTIIKKNWDRKNSGIGRTQVFGITNRRSLGRGPVNNNKKYPELYEALKKLGETIVPFEFEVIVINHNYITKPHIDKNNKGESLIMSFGEYEGGELVINGEIIDTKLKPVIFNGGLIEHYNLPLKSGDKYSVVFFNTKTFE